MFPFANKKCIGRRHQQHFQNRSQLRRQMRRLLFEGLENRNLLATFAEAGSLLNLDINVANTAVGIVSGGTSYTLTLTGDTWSGTDSSKVTGNGTTTLSVTTAGLGVLDTVNITDSANGSAVNFNNSSADSYGDTFNVNLDEAAGTITFNGASSFEGMAELSASTSRSIVLSSGASVSTFNGDIILKANTAGTTTGTFTGISLSNAIIASSGSGTVLLTGKGGDTGSNNYGVSVGSGSQIVGGSSGTAVIIDGTGGNSSVIGSSNFGVWLDSTGTTITSNGGGVQVTGHGGASGTVGNNHVGVFVFGGQISAGGAGTVTVLGIGGNSSFGANNGVRLQNPGARITSSGGAVQVTGYGGAAADNGSIGVSVSSGGQITAGGGGTVTVTGTGANGSGGSKDGIFLTGTGSSVTSGGDVHVTGTPGSGGFGINILSEAAISTAVNGGSITLVGDTMNLDSTAVVNAEANTVTLKPKTTGTTINLGGTDVTGTLGLTDAEVDRITAGVLRVWNYEYPSTAAITISQSISPAAASTLHLYSGSTVTQASGATIAVANLGINGTGAVSLGEANDVDTFAVNIGNGNVTFVDTDGFTVGSVQFAHGIGTNSGSVNLTATTGNITVASTPLTHDLEATGTISVTLLGDEAIFTLASGATVEADAGMTVTADKMVISGTIGAAGQAVTLKPNEAGEAINLGSTSDAAANTLELSDAELDRVTAGTLRIGDSTSGAITVSAAIDTLATSRLHLRTGGGVIVNNGVGITEGELAVTAGGAVGFHDLSSSDVDILAVTATSGDLQFRDTDELAVGTVDGVVGLSTNSGFIVVSVAGALTINQAVSAGGGGFVLSSLTNDALLTVNAPVSATSFGELHADKLAINAAISMPGQQLRLIPEETADDFDAIVLGSTTDAVANTLELSDAELDLITASVLHIGNTHTNAVGPITISAAITSAGFTDLVVANAGAANGIIFTPGGSLTAPGQVSFATDSTVTTDVTGVDVTSGSIHFSAPGGNVGSASIPLRMATGSLSAINAFSVHLYLHEADAVSWGTFGTGFAGSNSTAHLLGGTFTLSASNLISDTNSVSVEGGTFGIGAFRDTVGGVALVSGAITGTTGILTSTSNFDLRSGTVSAILGGSVGLNKTTSVTVTLGAANTYTSVTTVSQGTLLVNGSIANGPAAIDVVIASSGTLGGTGTVNGTVDVQSGGTVAPGLSPGLLNTGSVSLTSASTFRVELNGTTAGNGYDQLNVTGTVSLGGSTLDAVLGFSPPIGSTFVIVNKDGIDAITGTFAGLDEGASLTVGGQLFHISYVGGTGNDVVLTQGLCVSNTNDSGNGSLRQAILDANANPGMDDICFNIDPGSGVNTIRLLSQLPVVTDPITLDATTEPGFSGSPLVELDLSGAGIGASGLVISAGESMVRGLVINRTPEHGILLVGPNGGNRIEGNYIGTDSTGSLAMGNLSWYGVYVASSPNNVIGGTTPAARNVIGGYQGGIFFQNAGATANVVQGNFVGVSASGTAAVRNITGILIDAGSNIIGGTSAGAGNVVSGNSAGIVVRAGGNTIEGNYVGTDVTGTLDLGNTAVGIIIEAQGNTIGGPTAGAANVVSGNNGIGIDIRSSNNVIEGNLIGTNASGSSAIGNSDNGITISGNGSSNVIARNVISANNIAGIQIVNAGSMGNLIQGNYIGTNAAGTLALGNGDQGIYILNAHSNTIGGTAIGAGNLISGNSSFGIQISGATATGNIVQGNNIGTNAAGTAAVANRDAGVYILNAPSSIIGGTASGAGNVISGNASNGIWVEGATATGTLIVGNLVGLNAAGSAALGNGNEGIDIRTANNTIGGATAAARNVISGNRQRGIVIQSAGSTGNLVQGNYIGTDITGTVDLGNAAEGVRITTANNTVGGNTAAARNVISGNDDSGIKISGAGATGNVVQGNYVGTNATGNLALGNFFGIDVSTANNTIGGAAAGAGNLISGNVYGIYLHSAAATSNVVQGNLIGTNATGTAAVGNSFFAVYVVDGASNNLIGGTVVGAADRNVISGNGEGIVIDGNGTNGNQVQGNFIGTQADGVSSLGNSQTGIRIELNARNNTIGGSLSDAGNIIAFNGNGGILVHDSGTGNTISRNSIFNNVRLGINLGNDLMTPNDSGDADTGPNNLQNFPVLSSSFNPPSGGTAVNGSLNSTPNTTFTLEFFSSPTADASGFGEGKTYFGTAFVTTDAGGNVSFSVVFGATTVPAGQFVTATATDPSGNTSEFSQAIQVVSNQPPTADAGGPYTVAEGGSVQLDASSSSDPNQANTNLTYHWDLDGDNIFGEVGAAASRGNETGMTPTFSAAGLDGPSSITVSLRVTDNGGLISTDTATIEVTDVAPVIDTLAATSVDENGVVHLTGTYHDDGTQDTHDLTIDWDEGDPETVTVTGGSFDITHQYLDDNPTGSPNDTYTISVVLIDDDGGTTGVSTITANAVSTFATGFSSPNGLAFDSNGNLYVANYESGTINKVDTAGAVSLFASGFIHPEGLVFDGAGNLYVSHGDNNGTISRVTPGGDVAVFANNFTGLYYPKGLAFDSLGNLYAADLAAGTVTKLTPDGTASVFVANVNAFNPFNIPVTYLAGQTLSQPFALAFDIDDNLYISTNFNGTVVKVSSTGAFSIFASGFTHPQGLAFDAFGNLLVADANANTVSLVTPMGEISTLISGLNGPTGLTFDSSGILYIANASSNSVTKVTLSVVVTPMDSTTTTITNVAPTIDSMSATSVLEDGVVTLSGTYSDVGTQDTHTITINWGEGPPQTVTVSGGTFSVQHQYLDDNPTGSPSDTYTISVVLTDDDTDTDSASTTTTITNVAPQVFGGILGSGFNEGDVVTRLIGIVDPGLHDTFTVVVDWDDLNAPADSTFAVGTFGSLSVGDQLVSSSDGAVLTVIAVNAATGQADFSVAHQYVDDRPGLNNLLTTVVTVTDDDGGLGMNSTSVTVNNVAPTATLSDNGPIIFGQSATVSFSGQHDDSTTDITAGFHYAYSLTGDFTGVTYDAGTTTSVSHTYAGLNAGSYIVYARLIDKDNDYTEYSQQLLVDKAAAVVVVNGYAGVYDGVAHGATGFFSGVDTGGAALGASLSFGASFTNVPGGTAHWTFSGGNNYTDQSGTVDIVITKADSTINVTPYFVTYDANSHTATGTVSGIGPVNQGDLDLSGTAHTNAGTYLDSWTFTDTTGNYNNASGTVTNQIAKAAAGVFVNGYAGVYDGAVHGATGFFSGVDAGSAALGASLDLGASFTNVPGGTAHWTFSGGNNYTDQNGTVDIVITKANATINVTPYYVTYDGHAHSATGNAAGVFGESLALLDLSGTTHTLVGTYLDTWTFNDTTGNYYNASGQVTDVIRLTMGSGYILNPTASGAFTASGNVSVNLPTGLFVASNSPSAIKASGNASINVGGIVEVVGGVSRTGNAKVTKTGTPVSTSDPLAALTAPNLTGLANYGAVSVTGNTTKTLNPGIYSSIQISGNAKVTLNAGMYIIKGGGFTVSGNANVSGSGVTIFNAGSNYSGTTDGGNFGGITLSGNGSVSLLAPIGGTYADILIFQSRANTRAISISGNAAVSLGGIVYAANAQLTMSGNVQLNDSLVVNRVTVSGNVALTQLAAGSETTVDPGAFANTLLAGNLVVYIGNSDGATFSPDMLARIHAAMSSINTLLLPYSVSVSEVSDPSLANVVMEFGATSAGGSAADGVLGSYDPSVNPVQITLLSGWSWYVGADPAGIQEGEYDFQTSVMHELGHALGLGHSSDANSPMNDVLVPGTSQRIMTVTDLNIPIAPEGVELLMADEVFGEPKRSIGGPRDDLAALDDAPILTGRSPSMNPGAIARLVRDVETDLLIGGQGNHARNGGKTHVASTAGFTLFDTKLAAIDSVLAEWRTSRSSTAREQKLRDRTVSPNELKQPNANNFSRDAQTYFDDSVTNSRLGDLERDRLWADWDDLEIVYGVIADTEPGALE